jgi:hypothetical protein
MPELLLFAWDHSTQSSPPPSQAQLAALPKRFDLITWQADGWKWGADELSHPWFRLLAWPDADPNELNVLMSPLLPDVDVNMQPTTYRQYRGFHVDMTRINVPARGMTWFSDTMRAMPQLLLPKGSMPTLTVATVTVARAPLALPGVIPV